MRTYDLCTSSTFVLNVMHRCITLPTFVSLGYAARVLWLARRCVWYTVDGLFFKLLLCATVLSLTST